MKPTRIPLDQRFDAESGALYLTGTQTLVLMPLLQARLDARRGFSTAGYITGYRGSPLGGYDLQLARAKPQLGPMRLLGKLRRLRGTPFDPFGYSAERRREREAIGTYKQRVMDVLAKADAGNRDAAVEALAYAVRIRGYGEIKARSFVQAETKYAEKFAAPCAPRQATRRTLAHA